MFRSRPKSLTDDDADPKLEQRRISTFVISTSLIVALVAAFAIIVVTPALRDEIVSRPTLDKWLSPPAAPQLTKFSQRLPQEPFAGRPTQETKSVVAVKALPTFAFAGRPIAAVTAPVVKRQKPPALTLAVQKSAPDVVVQPFAPTSIAIYACFANANAKCGLVPVPHPVAALKRWSADASTYRRPWVVRVKEHLLQDEYWLCRPSGFNNEQDCWKLPLPTGFRPHMPDGAFAANSQ